MLWGIATVCTAAASTYRTLLAGRHRALADANQQPLEHGIPTGAALQLYRV